MSYINITNNSTELRCEISNNINKFISNNEFPFKFQIYSLFDKNLKWEVELYPGMWASFPQSRDINAKVISKSGIILKEYYYHYSDEDLSLYEFWDYFGKYNKSTGLILGCGDGLWGEWVNSLHINKNKCHLVEGSDFIFNQLKENYKNQKNVYLHNILISKDSSNIKFYDDGVNGNSSLNLEYINKLNNGINLNNIKEKSTVSLNDFLHKFPDITWIRFDLEGIDFELIMSLDDNNLNRLEMIQYEHLFLENEKMLELDLFLKKYNFTQKLVFDIDTIYLKNPLKI
jgi:FkbM family methyltransferase